MYRNKEIWTIIVFSSVESSQVTSHYDKVLRVSLVFSRDTHSKSQRVLRTKRWREGIELISCYDQYILFLSNVTILNIDVVDNAKFRKKFVLYERKSGLIFRRKVDQRELIKLFQEPGYWVGYWVAKKQMIYRNSVYKYSLVIWHT